MPRDLNLTPAQQRPVSDEELQASFARVKARIKAGKPPVEESPKPVEESPHVAAEASAATVLFVIRLIHGGAAWAALV